jgi:hypothetical protein
MATKIKAEKDGYRLVTARRGLYWIERDDNPFAGRVEFSGGKWSASRVTGFAMDHAVATARTPLEAFEAVIKPTYQEQFNKIANKVDTLGRGVCTTAWHCLVSGGENASETPGIEEHTEAFYELTVCGFWSLLDEYYQYTVRFGDDYPYTANIENDIEDGKIERY